MSGLLCQFCRRPADRNEEGVLWLIDAEPDDPVLWSGAPERTSHPPLCMPCAVAAELPLGDPRMPWMLAGRLVLALTDFTVTELTELTER